MEINFTGGSYQNRFVDIDDEETINWFVEHVDPPADPKSPKPMMPTPGLLQYVTIPGAPAIIRGFYVTSTGRAFVVYGNTLWEIVVNNKVVSRGTLSTTTGPVSMADNGQNSSGGRGLIIVDGQYGYMFNLSTAVFFRIQSPVQCPNSDNAVPAGCTGVAELITAFGAASVNIYSGDLFELQGTSGQTWTDTVDVVMTTAKDAAPGPGDVYVYYATPIPTIQFIKNYVDTSGNAIWPMSTTPTIAITEGTAGVPLPQSQSVRFMDGFFVLAQANTGQFFISQPYDGSNWDITQYATAEGTSDILVCIELIHY